MTLIPEYLWIAFTRMRLSSHRLRIETGRWARLQREHRLCRCGAIQDEQHVLQDCPLVQHIRDCYQKQVMYPDILQSASEIHVFKYIHDIMTYYEWTMRMLFVYYLNVCHMQSIWHLRCNDHACAGGRELSRCWPCHYWLRRRWLLWWPPAPLVAVGFRTVEVPGSGCVHVRSLHFVNCLFD